MTETPDIDRLNAEITRLRLRLDAVTTDPDIEDRETVWVMLRAENARLAAENEMLRPLIASTMYTRPGLMQDWFREQTGETP